MNKQAPYIMTTHDAAGLLPSINPGVNKYSRGTVGVIGGSAAYPGAPILASLAASRCGAGYVRLITPKGAELCARAHLLSIPVTGCEEGTEGTLCKASVPAALAALSKSKSLLVGPGLGTSQDAVDFFGCIPQDRPMLIDADALTIIAHNPELLSAPAQAPRIMTPHEGEAARLLGRPVADRCEDALFLAKHYDAVVLLKGPETLVATPCGDMRAITEGGPELAKAGTGDVLGGMIAAFLCQGLSAFDAASLGAFVHGRAGKQAAREFSVYAVMPEDIINAIGPTLLSLEA